VRRAVDTYCANANAQDDGPTRLRHLRPLGPVLQSQKVAIGLALTFSQDAFAADGSYMPEVTPNAADAVWREIATVLAPNDPPPTKK
jgi:hypothetical protein